DRSRRAGGAPPAGRARRSCPSRHWPTPTPKPSGRSPRSGPSGSRRLHGGGPLEVLLAPHQTPLAHAGEMVIGALVAGLELRPRPGAVAVSGIVERLHQRGDLLLRHPRQCVGGPALLHRRADRLAPVDLSEADPI